MPIQFPCDVRQKERFTDFKERKQNSTCHIGLGLTKIDGPKITTNQDKIQRKKKRKKSQLRMDHDKGRTKREKKKKRKEKLYIMIDRSRFPC